MLKQIFTFTFYTFKSAFSVMFFFNGFSVYLLLERCQKSNQKQWLI